MPTTDNGGWPEKNETREAVERLPAVVSQLEGALTSYADELVRTLPASRRQAVQQALEFYIRRTSDTLSGFVQAVRLLREASASYSHDDADWWKGETENEE